MMEKKTCGRKTEDRDQEDHGEETLGLSRTEKSRIRLNTKTDKHDVQCTIPSCGKWKMIWTLKLRSSMLMMLGMKGCNDFKFYKRRRQRSGYNNWSTKRTSSILKVG